MGSETKYSMAMNEPLIGQVPLFAKLPPEEQRYLAATLRPIALPKGTVLFREGEYGDHFYIVLEGYVDIIKALGTEDEQLLLVRGPGEFVGEMSLVSLDGLRTASVRAGAPAQLLEVTRVDFDALLSRQPQLAFEMLRVLSMRLRDLNDASTRDLPAKNRQL